jgi:hypothetical protein
MKKINGDKRKIKEILVGLVPHFWPTHLSLAQLFWLDFSLAGPTGFPPPHHSLPGGPLLSATSGHGCHPVRAPAHRQSGPVRVRLPRPLADPETPDPRGQALPPPWKERVQEQGPRVDRTGLANGVRDLISNLPGRDPRCLPLFKHQSRRCLAPSSAGQACRQTWCISLLAGGRLYVGDGLASGCLWGLIGTTGARALIA